MATIGFYGAAQQVTGSMYLLTTEEGYRILVDCGLSYEEGEGLESNANFPFDPEEIDLVILTHAHIDHSGNLPTLINKGYDGQIICTEPTASLVDILLSDSANIQGLRQQQQNRKKKGDGGYKRLYGHKQVMDTVDRIVTWPFNKPFDIHPGLKIELKPAGHILGASSVVITFTVGGVTKKIGFTGDLGNFGSQIVVDPDPMGGLDYIVMESTYGGRYRYEPLTGEEVLTRYIKETCVDQPGRLIIPAFSVGRTQAILFVIHKLFESGEIPRGIRVFADSKMGFFSTGIHSRFREYLNVATADFLKDHESLFRYPELYFIEDDNDREVLEGHYEPCIIVSSAGMLEGGRIIEHLINNIQNPASTFLIAGYCVPGTLGDQLLQGQKEIHLKGQLRHVYAKIASTDAFSAHPDHNGLMDYFSKVQKKSNLKGVFLTHGEPESMAFLKSDISELGFEVQVPEKGQEFLLQ